MAKTKKSNTETKSQDEAPAIPQMGIGHRVRHPSHGKMNLTVTDLSKNGKLARVEGDGGLVDVLEREGFTDEHGQPVA
jgi:hypothetical protein